MKNTILILAAILGSSAICAQSQSPQNSNNTEGYKFTIVKELPVTSVKNQGKAGTCWDYSGMAFIEAELLRMGKGTYDFSEMYTAYWDYMDRAMVALATCCTAWNATVWCPKSRCVPEPCIATPSPTTASSAPW